MTPRDIYVVATADEAILDVDALEETLAGDEVSLTRSDATHFVVTAGEVKIEIEFDSRPESLGWTPDLLTGAPELKDELASAHGFYRIRFVPGLPQSTVAVFEALWTVRAILDVVPGVVLDITSFKLHSQADIEEITELDFDIRDHLALHHHSLERPEQSESVPDRLWIHSHGMVKFGSSDVEMFQVEERDLPAAEKFLHELCTDLAFAQGPKLRSVTSTSVGEGFMLLPSDEGRINLVGVNNDMVADHQAEMVTVVGAEHRHNLSEMLSQYRSRFDAESEVEAGVYLATANRLLPTFKARFLRKGLMEPLGFLVRAPFEVHPHEAQDEVEVEQLWIEVVQWNDTDLIGKLVDGAARTSEWRKGAHVEVDESQINALALNGGGRMFETDEMERLLKAELPA